MIARLLCALLGHQPHAVRVAVVDQQFHRDLGFTSGWTPPPILRPCTRCPAYVGLTPAVCGARSPEGAHTCTLAPHAPGTRHGDTADGRHGAFWPGT